MKIFAETERLILREIVPADDTGMFELDSDKEVHRYLGNRPVERIEQSRELIGLIREQYISNGIGRWAAIEKNTGKFIGWAGLKLVKDLINGHRDYYDVGYRLIRNYWGKGFATEAALASLEYGFEKLPTNIIYATANFENKASIKVLEKVGLKYIETFENDYGTGIKMKIVWMEIAKEEWIKKQILIEKWKKN